MVQAVEVILPAEGPSLVLPAPTRYGDVVKLQGEAGNVGSVPTSNTTTQGKEIVMPSHDTAPLASRAYRRRKRGTGKLPRVYFAGCSCCGLIKVGFSFDYRQRMVELEARSGHRGLIVLGTTTGDREIEAILHSRFRRDRVEGEWFEPSAAIMAFIRESTIPAGWRGY